MSLTELFSADVHIGVFARFSSGGDVVVMEC